ncbi:MAG: serine/threonine-protein phosphatase [Phycisphaerales bacterium]|nr:MAG: serine/threonine-protein phosphatase [Phycisphaerales bacterium]
MGKAESENGAKVPRTFTDVLYLTNKDHMPSEVRRLLKQKKLSFATLGVDQYPLIRDQADLIGTVVIDAEDLDTLQQQKLAGIIESLEMRSVGVTLLTGRVELPVKSFSLAPTQSSFSAAKKVESISIDDLWVRISVNLAYRRRSSGIAAKPAAPSNQVRNTSKNQLAKQLQMAGTLVENLAEQLRLAGLVQRDFLPAQLPRCSEARWAAVFLPAEWVSGDIYDVVRLDEQHVGFYIADAVGHGMPAALLTIFVKQALVMRETRENNYRIFSPAEAMRNLNIRMCDQKLSGYQFATCCYCLLNTKTLQLTFARAGHPYPILIKPGEQPVHIEVRGSLLGVFQQAEYVQHTVQLERGDKLMLYSDGADSLIGNFDDQTGFSLTDDFCEIKDLPITEMMERLNGLAQNRKVDPAQIDDITMVGLEVL